MKDSPPYRCPHARHEFNICTGMMRAGSLMKLIIGMFYSASIIILAGASLGILNAPGIIAAGWALFLTIQGRIFQAGMIGITAAAISMIGQSLTAICTSCTMAAFAFATAGILCMLKSRADHPLAVAAMSAILCGSLVCYANPGLVWSAFINEPALGTVKQARANEYHCQVAAGTIKSGPEEVLLYVSPVCPACESLLPVFITSDPEGRSWTPVVVPLGLAERGQEWLFAKGYRGPVLAEMQSPAGAVPALLCGSLEYVGESEIEDSPYFMEITADKSISQEDGYEKLAQ